MAVSAGLIRDTFSTLLDVCGAPIEKQEVAIDILTLFTLVLTLFVAAECGNLNMNQLLESMQKHLTKHIEKVGKYLDEAIANGTIENRMITELNIALQQAKLRLAEDDVESFLDACTGALKAVGVPKELWKQDLQQAGEYSNRLLTLLNEGAQSGINEMTGFYQAG